MRHQSFPHDVGVQCESRAHKMLVRGAKSCTLDVGVQCRSRMHWMLVRGAEVTYTGYWCVMHWMLVHGA
jgi:hypothetical protein